MQPSDTSMPSRPIRSFRKTLLWIRSAGRSTTYCPSLLKSPAWKHSKFFPESIFSVIVLALNARLGFLLVAGGRRRSHGKAKIAEGLSFHDRRCSRELDIRIEAFDQRVISLARESSTEILHAECLVHLGIATPRYVEAVTIGGMFGHFNFERTAPTP